MTKKIFAFALMCIIIINMLSVNTLAAVPTPANFEEEKAAFFADVEEKYNQSTYTSPHVYTYTTLYDDTETYTAYFGDLINHKTIIKFKEDGKEHVLDFTNLDKDGNLIITDDIRRIKIDPDRYGLYLIVYKDKINKAFRVEFDYTNGYTPNLENDTWSTRIDFLKYLLITNGPILYKTYSKSNQIIGWDDNTYSYNIINNSEEYPIVDDSGKIDYSIKSCEAEKINEDYKKVVPNVDDSFDFYYNAHYNGNNFYAPADNISDIEVHEEDYQSLYDYYMYTLNTGDMLYDGRYYVSDDYKLLAEKFIQNEDYLYSIFDNMPKGLFYDTLNEFLVPAKQNMALKKLEKEGFECVIDASKVQTQNISESDFKAYTEAIEDFRKNKSYYHRNSKFLYLPPVISDADPSEYIKIKLPDYVKKAGLSEEDFEFEFKTSERGLDYAPWGDYIKIDLGDKTSYKQDRLLEFRCVGKYYDDEDKYYNVTPSGLNYIYILGSNETNPKIQSIVKTYKDLNYDDDEEEKKALEELKKQRLTVFDKNVTLVSNGNTSDYWYYVLGNIPVYKEKGFQIIKPKGITIDSEGQIESINLKKSRYKIYAKMDGAKKELLYDIRINKIKLPKKLNLKAGKTKNVKISKAAGLQHTWTWKSSNPDIATVSSDGGYMATIQVNTAAEKKDKVTITATNELGISIKSTVVVK